MVILGITDGDDSGACIVRDNQLVAAVNEERLTRMKAVIGFPMLAIQEVIRLSEVAPSDITGVAVAAIKERFNPKPVENHGWFRRDDSPGNRIKNVFTATLSPLLGKYSLPKKVYHRMQVRLNPKRREGIPALLKQLGIEAPVRFYNHHLCHALSAYATSGFDESALSVTLDGGGDGCCSHVYFHHGSSLSRLHTLDSFHSVGNFYSYVTHIAGFKASIHEGKITGLAAQGQPVYKDELLKMITYHDGEIVNVGNLYHHVAIKKIRDMLPSDFRLSDLAASIQSILEELAVHYVEYWVKNSGAKKVALAGGVFANVLLNQKIAQLPDIEEMYVFPHMGDGGLSVGAAYGMLGADRGKFPYPYRLENVYLGPEFSNDHIGRELKQAGLPHHYADDVEQEIAQLLVKGKVVARFNGRMEFGPRALGNRSILYQGTDPAVNKWLNKRLNRTEFMPFAPAVLPEFAHQCFRMIDAASRAATFMTVTYDCTEEMKQHCPAVVHIDGTARPQFVHQQDNPSFHKIIDEYRKITGIPAIVNTSFNMHEEPIVCTPNDAIHSFLEGRMDFLAIGNYVVRSPDHQEASV